MAAISDRLEPDRILSLTTEQYRESGISRAKEAYLRDLSGAVATGRLDLPSLDSAPDDEVIEQLTAVKGIGVWTAQMYLIFHLNRPDILPVGDLGIRMGLQRFHGLAEPPKPAQCPPLAEAWSPHRTLAMWYLWRLVEEGRSAQQ
jgi:DNA-3-methyladenine glycosylase II